MSSWTPSGTQARRGRRKKSARRSTTTKADGWGDGILPRPITRRDMTLEELIAEGRKLERPCLFLRPQGEGPVVAVWHERDRDEIARTGHRALLTVDTRHVPGLSAPTAGYLTIFTDHKRCEGGRIEQSASWPKRKGTPLYAHAASVLPPSDALFARGSQ